MSPNRLGVSCGSAFKYQLVSITIKDIPPSERPVLHQDQSAGEDVGEQCLGENKRPNCCGCLLEKEKLTLQEQELPWTANTIPLAGDKDKVQFCHQLPSVMDYSGDHITKDAFML